MRFALSCKPLALLGPLAAVLLSGCVTINVGGSPESEIGETLIQGQQGPKVLLLDIDGEITSANSSSFLGWVSSEGTVSRLRDQLALAEQKGDIAAILLRIDSPGGSPTASDAIYRQIVDFKRKTSVPVLAQFLGMGTSGAYFIAMAADEVVATRTTVTGSIGVVLLGFNLSELMEKIGVDNQTFTSGAFKDAGSMFRPMSQAEREQLQSVVDDLYDQFVLVVAEGRPKLSVERVRELADGRIYSATQALEVGLVDRIDTLDGSIETLRRRLGAESVQVVSYHRKRSSLRNIYSRATAPGSFKTPTESLAKAWPRPGFYYLWWPGADFAGTLLGWRD